MMVLFISFPTSLDLNGPMGCVRALLSGGGPNPRKPPWTVARPGALEACLLPVGNITQVPHRGHHFRNHKSAHIGSRRCARESGPSSLMPTSGGGKNRDVGPPGELL